MKTLWLILAASITAMHGICEEPPRPQASTNGVAFREPFTLKLHVDKEYYYEQKFPKIPYVYQDDVYLFKGDSFGIDLQITNGVIGGFRISQTRTRQPSLFDSHKRSERMETR